jgi:hypothetical protein
MRRHPFLHSAPIQSQGQNSREQRMYRERNRIERMIGQLAIAAGRYRRFSSWPGIGERKRRRSSDGDARASRAHHSPQSIGIS